MSTLPLRVRDLIELLQQQDPEAAVIVSGTDFDASAQHDITDVAADMGHAVLTVAYSQLRGAW